MPALVLIILVIFALGGLPQTGWHSYGYAPSSVGVVLIVLLIVMLLTGRL